MQLIELIRLLNTHRSAYYSTYQIALDTKQPDPIDTRAWSQILISLLTDTPGVGRKKGSDLVDGSDVKSASVWGAINTPRFNGVIKAGTKSKYSGKIEYLDNTPYLFLVLWDRNELSKADRCRVWAVSPQTDLEFRRVASLWYEDASSGKITSHNFQLHPPRNKNSDVIGNSYGKFVYPLIFSAEFNISNDSYAIIHLDIAAKNNKIKPV